MIKAPILGPAAAVDQAAKPVANVAAVCVEPVAIEATCVEPPPR